MKDTDEDAGEVDVVATVNGGATTARAVAEAGALVGFETGGYRPPRHHDIAFCDYPFTKADATYEDHREIVERERPRIAVAPDLDETRDRATVLEQADELAQWADTVVVIPKAVRPESIPERFRVGVPLANFGDDLPWQWDAYAGVDDLHLLGGSPTVQLEFARYIDGIRSVDGASVLMGAGVGEVWAPAHERTWHETGADQLGYYDRIRTSLRNVIEAWRVHRTPAPADYTIPLAPEDWAEHVEGDDAVAEVDWRQAYHRHGARGAAPTISPDDADCLTAAERDQFEILDWDAERHRAEREAVERFRDSIGQTHLEAFAEGGIA